MRYERFATALLLSMGVVLVSATGCNGDKAAPEPKKAAETTAGTQAVDLASDIVSGCVSGAPLVKVLIDLKPKDGGRCVPEVTPASVCVAPGGVVRFKIQNGCPPPSGGGGRALEITRPVFKLPLTTRLPTPGPTPTPVPPPLFQSCELRVQPIDKSERRVVWCDVAENAHLGFYKYGLTGQIEHLDPDVEVQPPD